MCNSLSSQETVHRQASCKTQLTQLVVVAAQQSPQWFDMHNSYLFQVSAVLCAATHERQVRAGVPPLR